MSGSWDDWRAGASLGPWASRTSSCQDCDWHDDGVWHGRQGSWREDSAWHGWQEKDWHEDSAWRAWHGHGWQEWQQPELIDRYSSWRPHEISELRERIMDLESELKVAKEEIGSLEVHLEALQESHQYWIDDMRDLIKYFFTILHLPRAVCKTAAM